MQAKIALITGGFTGEAEVSLKSAAFVLKHIDSQRFEVYPVILTVDSWYHQDDAGNRYEVDRKDFSLHLPGKDIRFDLAFIMLHGSPGEDGRLQGYFDLIGLKYTTCDTLTSALTMNKAYTKALLQGIPELNLAKSICLSVEDRKAGEDWIIQHLELPYFVKPNGGGSSLGMTKVKEAEGLSEAVDKAFATENASKQVLVEQFVSGREFSIGVYRNRDGVQVLPATEVVTSREFFDYDAKYVPGLTQEITPADLSTEQTDRVERLVREVYGRLNCRGLVRIDFFLERGTDRFYFIEINTVPGQTETSFIPQQVRAMGKKEKDFYTELLEEALEGA